MGEGCGGANKAVFGAGDQGEFRVVILIAGRIFSYEWSNGCYEVRRG